MLATQINKFLINFLMYVLLFLVIYAVHISSLFLVILIVVCLVPATYFASTYSLNYYILSFVVISTILYALHFNAVDIYILIILWVVGYFLACCFKQRQSKMMIYIWMVCLINILVVIGLLLLKINGHGVNIATIFNDEMIARFQFELDKGLLVQSEFDKLIDQIHEAVQLVPALIFINLSIISLISLNVTCSILKKLKIVVPKFYPLRMYNIPKSLAIIWIMLLILNMIMYNHEGTLSHLFVNLMCILTVICMIQGISFLFEAIHQYRLPIILKGVVVIGSIFFLNFIAILGMMDVIFKGKQKIKQ